MAQVEAEIFINAPVDRVYQMWSNFEQLPQFLQHVKQVRKIGDNRYHWVVEGMGQNVEFDAEVTEQQPNTKIAWQAVNGIKNRGAVEFRPEGSGARIRLIWAEQQGGPVTEAAERLTGFAKETIQEDLERFKRACEEQSRQAA